MNLGYKINIRLLTIRGFHPMTEVTGFPAASINDLPAICPFYNSKTGFAVRVRDLVVCLRSTTKQQ